MASITQLDVGEAFHVAMNQSRCNGTQPRLAAFSGQPIAVRFENYIRATTHHFEDSIASGIDPHLIRDMVGIQQVHWLIDEYGNAHADNFLTSLRPVILAINNLMLVASRYPQVQRLLDGNAAMTATEPLSNAATASKTTSSLIRAMVPQFRQDDLNGLGTLFDTLSEEYPAVLEDFSDSEKSSEFGGSSRLSQSTVASSVDGDLSGGRLIDDFAAQKPKESPPPAISIV